MTLRLAARRRTCEWESSKWIASVIEVKYKWLLSFPDEMQVPVECLASARQGRAADLRVILSNTEIVLVALWLLFPDVLF